MTNKKGKMHYVPEIIIDELDNIQQDMKITRRADAFRELANYSRVGRKVMRITNETNLLLQTNKKSKKKMRLLPEFDFTRVLK